LVEDSESGSLLGWGCNSEPVKGRPRLRENQEKTIDRSRNIEFCCSNFKLSALAEALDDLIATELVVPKGKHRELISHCAVASIDDIIRDVGLIARA